MENNRCLKCKCYIPQTEESGECHRFPPVPIYIPNINSLKFIFPIVNENNICGDYKGLIDIKSDFTIKEFVDEIE